MCESSYKYIECKTCQMEFGTHQDRLECNKCISMRVINPIPINPPIKVNDILHDQYWDKWGIVRFDYLDVFKKKIHYVECILTNEVMLYWETYQHFIYDSNRIINNETTYRVFHTSEMSLMEFGKLKINID